MTKVHAPIQLATIEGPIPGESGAPASPFGGAQGADLLKSYAYVEEEFFIRGAANAVGLDGEIVAEAAPYVTRIIVRRPADLSRMSGRAIIEPFHISFELPAGFGLVGEHALRSGDVWVGVTVSASRETSSALGGAPSSSSGVHFLRHVQPERYSVLSLYDPIDIEDWQPPRDEMGRPKVGAQEERWGRLIYASAMPQAPGIMAQVGALLKTGGSPHLIGGRAIQRLYAIGNSQTSVFWSAFLNGGYHETARMENGTPIISGYLTGVGVEPRHKPADAVVVNMPSQSEVEMWIVQGEHSSDDTDAPKFRSYELPGVGHGMGGLASGDPRMPHAVQHADVPLSVLGRAAYANMDRWVSEGVPMPRAPRLARDPAGGFALDEHGNVQGGVPNPWLLVPRGSYFVGCTCSYAVTRFAPFDEDKMRRLYPSDGAYREQFNAVVDRMVDERWLLAEDVQIFKGT